MSPVDRRRRSRVSKRRAVPAANASVFRDAVLWLDAEATRVTDTTVPNRGMAGSVLNAQYGNGSTASTFPTLLEHTGTNYLYLPGVSGNNASVPSAIGSPTDIAGDLAIAFHISDRATDDAVWIVKRQFGVDSSLFSYNFSQFNNPQLVYRFIWTESGGTNRDVISTIPFRSDRDHHAVTHDVDDGTGGNVVSFYSSNDGTNWNLEGSVRNAYTTNHRSNAANVGIGGTNVGVVTGSGKYHRARIWGAASLSGTPVLDVDFTKLVNGSQTAFVEDSTNAATVTINRSTSGRKSVAVTRPVWLFGTDDYMEVADNDLLDFGATDSFTVMAVVRQWATLSSVGEYVNKQSNAYGPTTPGYELRHLSSGNPQFISWNGTADSFATTMAAAPLGSLAVIAGGINRATSKSFVQVGATRTDQTGTSTNINLSNSTALRVGRLGDSGSSFADMELFAVAVWRRALTAAEIARVVEYYESVSAPSWAHLVRDESGEPVLDELGEVIEIE